MASDSQDDVSQAVDIEWGKGVSYDDDFLSDTSSPARQKPKQPASVTAKEKDPVSLGKLIRECARPPNVRPRDRWRERSVSRACEHLFASKRKTSGLPPVFRPPAYDSKFRVPSAVLPPRRTGAYRNSGSRMQPPPSWLADDRRIDTVSSVNASYIQQSIKVRVVFCCSLMHMVYGKTFSLPL